MNLQPSSPELFPIPDCVVQDLWDLCDEGYLTRPEAILAIRTFGHDMKHYIDEHDYADLRSARVNGYC